MTEYNEARQKYYTKKKTGPSGNRDTIFIKTGEWVISQPSVDVSTIWLLLLQNRK
jgi:hypothetical protein